jgi:hypothetical protein
MQDLRFPSISCRHNCFLHSQRTRLLLLLLQVSSSSNSDLNIHELVTDKLVTDKLSAPQAVQQCQTPNTAQTAPQ